MLVLWPWADARTWGLLHGERLLLDKVSSHRWKKQNGGGGAQGHRCWSFGRSSGGGFQRVHSLLIVSFALWEAGSKVIRQNGGRGTGFWRREGPMGTSESVSQAPLYPESGGHEFK